MLGDLADERLPVAVGHPVARFDPLIGVDQCLEFGFVGIRDGAIYRNGKMNASFSAHSATFDLTQTVVLDKRFARVLAWYDNEWGFSNRMVEAAALVGKLG